MSSADSSINNGNLKDRKEESPYKCSFCDRAFADRTGFEQHQFKEHRDRQTI